MRATVFFFVLTCSFSSQAGFMDKIGTFIVGAGGGYVGGNMAKGSCQPSATISRAEKVNTLLWEMHRTNYEQNYKTYLSYLENSREYKENIYFPDTVAFVYLDHGDHKKALDIYEKDIIPWIQFESIEKQGRYRRIHKALKERNDCLVMCGGVEDRLKEISMSEDDKIKQAEEDEEKNFIKRVDEGAKKIGGRLRDKARDIVNEN